MSLIVFIIVIVVIVNIVKKKKEDQNNTYYNEVKEEIDKSVNKEIPRYRCPYCDTRLKDNEDKCPNCGAMRKD